MKVEIDNRERIMLVPETDFEEEYLKNYFGSLGSISSDGSDSNKCDFIRISGSSLADLVGIVIKQRDSK